LVLQHIDNDLVKFAKIDKEYLSKRKNFSNKYGQRELWNVIDHWPLYCGIQNLARNIVISDLLRSTLDVPGHVAEFGSWRGANLLFVAKLLRIFDPMGSKIVHCFESFEGLNDFGKEDPAKSKKLVEGRYKGSYKELMDIITLYHLNHEIEIHKGRIESTLPKVLSKNKSLTFSFVYCDVDLYEPTRIMIENLHHRLSKGGLFIFDEWNDEKWQGETQAANEFLKEHSDEYEILHVKHTRQPSLVIKKMKH